MATLHSPRLAPPPRAEDLLRDELARFRSELHFVRASFEGEALGKSSSLQVASDLSSDESDWSNDVPGHLEPTSYAVSERRLWKETIIVSPSKKSTPELYAPNEPPTRQRPQRQPSLESASVKSQDADESLENTALSSVLPHNSTWNLKFNERGDSWHPKTAQSFSRFLREQATGAESIADAIGEKDEQAQEMALRIQLLLEGHANTADTQDLTWLLGSLTGAPSKNQTPSLALGRQSEAGADKIELSGSISSQSLTKHRGTRSAGGQAAKPGSEEAQAYLRRVLAHLVPAQRLTALEKRSSLGGNQSLEMEPESAGVQEGKREVATNEEKAVQTSVDALEVGPRSQVDIPLAFRAQNHASVALVESIPSRDGSGTPPYISSVGKEAAGDESAAEEPQEIHVEQIAMQQDASGESVLHTPKQAPETLSPSAYTRTDPAPRPKLALAPALRGGPIHRPTLKVPSCPADQTAKDDQWKREGQLAPPSGNQTTRDGGARGQHASSAAGPALDIGQELLSKERAGTQPVHPMLASGAATEMEKRMELLETIQRRALELEEQKLQHEISMHQRRAELQLQAMGSTSNRVDSAAEPDNRGPLGPASFLLGRARDAANEVNAAVGKLQAVELSSASGDPVDNTSGSPALSRQLATAVTELKEMLDKKLGEFYAACASFHAASLQGAAKLAQAAREGQKQSDGETRAAGAHEMARQTAELDTLRKQVRGSHQKALQSPAFHLQTPLSSKPPPRTRSRSSNASQSSKRGPQDIASAAAELASGLRELEGDQRAEPPAGEWPGLDSAVEEAVRAAEGHGVERQLLTHAAHAKWRDIAAREEERADSAKAAVQALLGDAFDYEAARKELELITRVAKGVPERARVRAKDSAFQALAYASASQKQSRPSDMLQHQPLDDEARFLESLRQDVDRRIAAAAALSTGMIVGAKRRKISDPTEPLTELPDLLRNRRPAREHAIAHAEGKENRSVAEPLSAERPRQRAQAQRREEKPVVLKKVEIAFGHKVQPKLPAEATKRQAKKRKESDSSESWVKRMSAPRRPLGSPRGEAVDPKREVRLNVPRRSTLRPAEMLHRPATAIRWPSPEPRRPRTNDASTNVRQFAREPASFADLESPMGRLAALARDAAVGVEFESLLPHLDEQSEGEGPDARGFVGNLRTSKEYERAPGTGTMGAETSAERLTDWFSEQVLSQLLQQPSVLDGLRRTASTDSSDCSTGVGVNGVLPDITAQFDDVSIDEELVRALAAEVISEEVERALAERRKKEEEAGVEEIANDDEAAELQDEGSSQKVTVGFGQEGSIEPMRLVKEDTKEVSMGAPFKTRELQVEALETPILIRAEEPKQSEASSSMLDQVGGVPQPESRPSTQPPLASHFSHPFPILPGVDPAVGWVPTSNANQTLPFIPFPFYYLPDGRFLPGFQAPNAPPTHERGIQQTAQSQTEPQIGALPTLRKLTSRKNGKESPATPPTPSTPSSSPEVTLVSRRRARRGFEAALETMGIQLQLDPESRVAVHAQATAVAVELEEQDVQLHGGGGSVSAIEDAQLRREEAQEAADDPAAHHIPADEDRREPGDEDREPENPKEPIERLSSEGRAAPDEAIPTESKDDVAPEEADMSAEKSPGSRTRRKWAFLDARWDARQAIDSMTRTLLMGAAEETSSRSGEATTASCRGTVSGSEATSVSFGQVAADLLSDPPSVKVPGHESPEPPHVEKNAATSSLSEGEAEPGDLRQDQEPGQRRRFALPELSTDSEPGLIHEEKGPVGNSRAARASRATYERDRPQSTSDSDSSEIGRVTLRRSTGGRKRMHIPRSAPKKEVIRNAVATLRSLARRQAESGASEGEMESGVEEGEVGKVLKEAGQVS